MKIAFTLALALVTTASAYADTLVTARPIGTDNVDWTQLGGAFTGIPQTFTFTTTSSVAGSGVFATGPGQVRVQTTGGWAGNFTSGNILAWTQGSGPLTLAFAGNYSQIGAQFQADSYGPFTAQICTSISCFTEAGISNANGDGSAIYIGIQSSTPFNSVTFSLTSGGEDFAINFVTLNGATVTPEPSSIALLGTGVLGAVGMMRRRFIRS